MLQDIKASMANNLATETFPISFDTNTLLKDLTSFKQESKPAVHFDLVKEITPQSELSDTEKKMIEVGKKQIAK
jgi:hypothetical protein